MKKQLGNMKCPEVDEECLYHCNDAISVAQFLATTYYNKISLKKPYITILKGWN